MKERRRRRRGFDEQIERGLRDEAAAREETANADEPLPESDPARKVAVRKKAAKGGRKRRLTVLVGALVALGAVAFGVWFLRRQRDLSNVWRLHDEAAVLYAAGKFEDALAANRAILVERPDDKTARFNAGAALLELDRDEEGWREIEAVAAADADFDAAHFALARRAVSAGREDEAVRELTLVVAAPPCASAARVLLATLLRRRGETSRAMDQMRIVFEDREVPGPVRLGIGVRLAELHGLRARVHRDAGKEKQKETATYRTCLELADELLESPDESLDKATIHGQRARAFLALGRNSQALADVDDAIGATSDPAARSALRALRAQVYELSGNHEEAAKDLEAALSEAATPPPETFTSAADFYVAQRLDEQALELLARAVTTYPKHEELGLAYVRQLFLGDRADEAEREAERLAGELPASTRVLLRLGDLRRLRGDFEGARAAFAIALERDAEDPITRMRVADTAFSEAGAEPSTEVARLAEAERLAREVLDGNPESVEALVVLAKVELARFATTRDARPARKLLLQATDLDPFSLEAHTFLAYADLLERNYDEAVLGFERVLGSLPEDRPALRVLLARAYLGMTQPRPAVEAARLGVAGRPDDVGALQTLVAALHANRELDEALLALARLEALQPDELVHVLLQAQIRAEKGDVAGAEERFAHAKTLAGAITDGDRSMDELNRVAAAEAAFYQGLGDLDSAQGAFRSVLGSGNADGHVRYGRFLLALGQAEDAEREFQAAIALDPGSVGPRRALADLYFDRRAVTPELIALVERVASGHSGDAVVDYLRGKLAYLQGDLRVATDLLTRYVRVRDEDASGHFALGVVLSQAGRYEQAVGSMERAARLAPRNAKLRVAVAKTRYAWAEQLMRRGRVREAKAALERTAQEDPGAAAPRQMLARAMALTGSVELSVQEIRLLLREDPTDRVSLRMLASLYMMRREYDQAREHLATLLAAHPDDWSGWTSLALVELELAHPEEALVAARKARAAAPDEPLSLAGVIQVLMEQSRVDEARSEVAAALQGDPEAAQYHHLAGVVALRQGRFADVILAAESALDREPGLSAAFHNAIATLVNHLKDPAKALAFARSRSAKAPEALDMQHVAATLEWRSAEKDQALVRLEALVARDPPYPRSAAFLASIHAERGEATAGRDVLKRALEAYPETADFHFLLGESYLKQAFQAGAERIEDPERGLAIQAFGRAFELREAHPPTLNNLAYLLYLEGEDLERALGMAHAATELAPEHVPYFDSKGEILLAMGHAKAAVDVFRAALGLLEKREATLRRAEQSGSLAGERLTAEWGRLGRERADVRAHYDQALEASRDE